MALRVHGAFCGAGECWQRETSGLQDALSYRNQHSSPRRLRLMALAEEALNANGFELILDTSCGRRLRGSR